MMGEVTVQVTEKQAQFLKLFAEKQGSGKEDNMGMNKPLHIVQNLSWDIIPYSEEIEEYYDRDDLYFTTDDDYEEWFGSEVENIKNYFNSIGGKSHTEIKPFNDVKYEKIEAANGILIDITDYYDYFAAYNVPANLSWRKKRYTNTAYFFILDEAKKFMEYQGHNLNEPRIFTVGQGYGNGREYEHFYSLLQTIGNQLIKESN